MRRKRTFYISTGIFVLTLAIALIALNNSTALRSTLDGFGGSEGLQNNSNGDSINRSYSGPCRAEDWQCDSWEINCNQRLLNGRRCEKVNNCRGGITPKQTKKCSHLGNPQKHSVFSNCDNPERAIPGESLTIRGLAVAENGHAIKNAYVWLTDKDNSRLYLETLSGEDGVFNIVVGFEALSNLEGKIANLHIAPVEAGYGANAGSTSSRPQCAGFGDRSSNSDTSVIIEGSEVSLVQSATFAEEVVEVKIPDSAAGKTILEEISISLLEDPDGIRYRVLE